MEKISVGWARLESRYGDAGFFQLVSETVSEGKDKDFGCSINGLRYFLLPYPLRARPEMNLPRWREELPTPDRFGCYLSCCLLSM